MSETTTAELEREAQAARARVADTAESIRNKMTPGQMIDEFTGLFSGGDGSAALNNLKAQVRDNPLPLTLIGTGLAWLMLGSGPGAQASPPPQPAHPARPGYIGSGEVRQEGFTDRASEFAGDTTSAVGDAVRSASEYVSDTASSVTASVSEASQSMRHTLADGREWVKGAAGGATAGARNFASKAKQSASDLLESEPLVLAALGLVLGTAIGAMLPRTDVEDENLGEYADELREQAAELMDKGVEGAKTVAAETYETVKQEADRQGMSSGSSIVDKVSEVVKATTAKTEESIRDKVNPGSA